MSATTSSSTAAKKSGSKLTTTSSETSKDDLIVPVPRHSSSSSTFYIWPPRNKYTRRSIAKDTLTVMNKIVEGSIISLGVIYVSQVITETMRNSEDLSVVIGLAIIERRLVNEAIVSLNMMRPELEDIAKSSPVPFIRAMAMKTLESNDEMVINLKLLKISIDKLIGAANGYGMNPPEFLYDLTKSLAMLEGLILFSNGILKNCDISNPNPICCITSAIVRPKLRVLAARIPKHINDITAYGASSLVNVLANMVMSAAMLENVLEQVVINCSR